MLPSFRAPILAWNRNLTWMFPLMNITHFQFLSWTFIEHRQNQIQTWYLIVKAFLEMGGGYVTSVADVDKRRCSDCPGRVLWWGILFQLQCCPPKKHAQQQQRDYLISCSHFLNPKFTFCLFWDKNISVSFSNRKARTPEERLKVNVQRVLFF